MAEMTAEAPELGARTSGGVIARRVSLLALIPVILFGALAHVFGALPAGLGAAGLAGAGGTGYAAWRGRKVRKAARPASRIVRQRRTITRTPRVRRPGGGMARRKSSGPRSGTPSAFRRKPFAGRRGPGAGQSRRSSGARKAVGSGRRPLAAGKRSGPAKAGSLGMARKGRPASRSRLGLRSGASKSRRSGAKPAAGKTGSGRRPGILRRRRPGGSASRRQRPLSPVLRKTGSKGPARRRGASRPGARPGTPAAARRGLRKLVPGSKRRAAAKARPHGTRTGGAAKGKTGVLRPGTRAAIAPSRQRRTAAQRAALRKANRKPLLTRRQKLARKMRRTRPPGHGAFARSLRHPVRPQRLTPAQRRARHARIRQRRAALRRARHPRQWRLPRRHRPPMSLARRIPYRFRRIRQAAARFDQARLNRWLGSRRVRARRPRLLLTPPAAVPVSRAVPWPPPGSQVSKPRPGPRIPQARSGSEPVTPAGGSSGGHMTFQSRIAAVAETAHEQIGSWEPGGGKDVEQALASLPELCEELAQAIGSIGARMGDGPFEQAATESFNEAASRFSGLGDEFAHAHQVFRNEHADELRRLEEPRSQEQMWDTDKQEEPV